MKYIENLQLNSRNVIKWEPQLTAAEISSIAKNSAITLAGTVNSYYKKSESEEADKNVAVEKAMTNGLTIKSDEDDTIEKAAIEEALLQSWSIDDEEIKVEVSGRIVTLTGTVNSVYQKNEATRLAWNVPKVWLVKNDLVIDYYLIDG